jgi:hypothetical protein
MSDYNIRTHGDFKKYYDTNSKSNIWVLGYFGGGAVNIIDAYKMAVKYTKSVNVPLESIQIDEILSSRRYKGFKFIYSSVSDQIPESDSYKMEGVYAWLRD